MKKFSLIIPVYKQEATIYGDVSRIFKVLTGLHTPFEMIVVIDGYLDDSSREAKKIKSPHLKVTGYKTNHGKGYAVRYGFAQATGDVIGFIDAGGDLDPTVIPLMLDRFEWSGADILIGSKRHPDSVVVYPWYRKLFSWGYQQLIRMLFGFNIRDSQVGLKIYRRIVLEKVLPRLLVKQFAFDIEMLSVAYHLGFRKIYESPVRLSYRFTSTITSSGFWRIIMNMLKDTLAVYYRLKILKYYDNEKKRNWKFDPELNFKVNTG